MGLDMYLMGSRFVWSHGNEPTRAAVGKKIAELFPEVADVEVYEIQAEIAYWRKANAIHNWFVENTQGGVDECQNTSISRDQLRALLDVVNQVLENPELGPTLLPTRPGFFFGGIEYGEYYIQDLQHTKTRVELALSDKFKDWDFQYHSSW